MTNEQPQERSAAENHRRHAAAFTARVEGVPEGSWDAPAPVEGWVARDVVRHLVEWLPAFLESSAGLELRSGPSVDEDPVAAWATHRDAVQELLDDPATADRTVENPHIGSMPLSVAVDRIYTPDVFMHTWDLARATGQDERLDPEMCRAMFEGMQPIEEMLRSSGQYGPAVPVPDDADWQTRLLGFIGRQP